MPFIRIIHINKAAFDLHYWIIYVQKHLSLEIEWALEVARGDGGVLCT